MDKYKTLLRSQLYELVWQNPVTKLASMFGLSDRGLGKLCARHKIPIPKRGYWQKFKAGYCLSKPALPKLDGDKDPMIAVYRTEQPEEASCSKEIEQAIAYEKDTENSITVQEDQEITHPLALKIRRGICKKKSQEGYALSRKGGIDILSVTAANIDRAVKILDSLFTALEARGHRVVRDTKNETELTLFVFDEEFSIQITERIRHERVQNPRDYWHRWNYHPTGILRFEYVGKYAQGKVSDTSKRKRIDRCINEILIRLYKASERNKVRRAEVIENEKRWKIEQELWEKKRREEVLERHRVELLTEAADKGLAINKIRSFIEDVKADIPLYQLSGEQREQFDKMINWAEEYVQKKPSATINSQYPASI